MKSTSSRILSMILSFCMVLSLAIPAFAYSENAYNSTDDTLQKYEIPTEEDAMPLVLGDALLSQSTRSNTLSIPARANWARKTASILEEAYEQKVVNIAEDNDFIVFYYICDETKLEEGQLLLTKYLKPESKVVRGASINTKMNYAWGWSRGYSYKNDRKSALFSAASGVALSVFADNLLTMNLGTIFSAAIAGISATVDYSRPITATDWVKFYYCNKIGCVQDTTYGYWLPYAYVGERRGFNKIETIIYDKAGQPHTVSYMEEDGKPSSNPTNSRRVQKKSHYDDDAWIIRTALSQYKNDDGVYSDIFEVVGNISDKMP